MTKGSDPFLQTLRGNAQKSKSTPLAQRLLQGKIITLSDVLSCECVHERYSGN